MSKRSRERHLAKLAAQRQAERDAARRRREHRVIAALSALGVVAAIVVGFVFFGGKSSSGACATPTVSTGPTASPTPTAAPGTQIGTIKPTAVPPKVVACHGKVPKGAGKPKPQFAGPPPNTVDPTKTYLATMETSCGTVVIQLDPKTAPVAVNSFVFLAQKGFYDGLTFHRIVKGFVIQGGDPKGDGTGGAGYQFPIETNPKVTFDSAGLIAYANSGPGTNGSQFFITLAKLPQLNPSAQGSYTIFGKVIKGFDVVKRIGDIPGTANPGIPNENSVPTQAVYIDSVTISVKK
ncbi:MAG: peptidylprolyl isomerase [Actinomycetota bacterium]